MSCIKKKRNLNEINNIRDVEIDTFLNKNFFSYRRTTQNRKSDIMKKATGRQVSVIGLKQIYHATFNYLYFLNNYW